MPFLKTIPLDSQWRKQGQPPRGPEATGKITENCQAIVFSDCQICDKGTLALPHHLATICVGPSENNMETPRNVINVEIANHCHFKLLVIGV